MMSLRVPTSARFTARSHPAVSPMHHVARAAAPATKRPVALAAQAGSGMSPELRAAIDRVIKENKVVAFIKGTKLFPQCGFSNTVVQVLNTTGVEYLSVDILENDKLRSGMKEYSQWPTFPQVYIGGEFLGGCDILMQAYQSGELKETLEKVRME